MGRLQRKSRCRQRSIVGLHALCNRVLRDSELTVQDQAGLTELRREITSERISMMFYCWSKLRSLYG